MNSNRLIHGRMGEAEKKRKKIFNLSGVLTLLLVVGMAGILTGCGDVNIKWQEEVRMEGGEMLLTNRTAKGKVAGSDTMFGPDGWNPTEMTLEVVKLPAHWTAPPIWRDAYVPILLDYRPEENIWSLVVTFAYCDGWERLGEPELPYGEWQSRGGGPWQRIPLEERLIGRKTNLLTGPRSDGENDFINADERDRRNRRAAIKYREIIAKWEINSCSKGP
jgi:hypothetical protein